MATVIGKASTPTAATVIKFATKVKTQNTFLAGNKKNSAPPVIKFLKWMTEL